MQPLVMDMLHAIARAVGASQKLVDTHASNYLKLPTGMIDCCGLRSDLVAWTQLVVPWEFKLSSTQAVSLLGQLITRCIDLFDKQPQCQCVYAVGIMLDAVEVFTISRVNGMLSVAGTGLQPLSINSQSPGLQLVASVLQAAPEELGFCSPRLPASIELGGYTMRNLEVIQDGTARPGGHPGTYVFRVAVDGLQEPAVLKLGFSDREVIHPSSKLCSMLWLPFKAHFPAESIAKYALSPRHSICFRSPC